MRFQLKHLLLLTSLLGLAEAGRSRRTTDPELIIRDGTCQTEIPCDGNDYVYSAAAAPSPAGPVAEDTVQLEARMTNAERLARGLPLNKPAPRRTSPHVARAQSSPAPVVTYTARIRIDRADGTGTLGYVGAVTGAQALLQTSAANAVVVSFSLPVGSTSGSQINLAVTSPVAFPNIGLIQGRDSTSSDLSTDSFNYIYIGETSTTAAGAPPASVGNAYTSATNNPRTAESAVWNVDVTTFRLVPTWINTDGSAAPTNLFTQGAGLYASGSQELFTNRYPAQTIAANYFIELIV
ncbi:uncharacterized protein MKK02DRAFT_40173 [Dioszegia hungarica]|uniref:Uncharacterized protein n=1 Tax=Dioszegia hungarica TaxID=4972 RepID=A0AA38HFZ1_9TREE|nr:uncharacterized protein MKK02DRAFT_40173 [Dioszegia hungarica]KAI9639845.1 hypothetical protein MKK02DRAFT_40173 [Dioszegia hungarica]